MERAIFLDRDGIINEVIIKDGKPFSPRNIEEFVLLLGIDEFLKISKRFGFLNIVITNQPDISRRLLEISELNKMHKIIMDKLPIDDILVCIHDDMDNCDCRKPKPGLILKAAEKWNIDLSKSFMIGDRWKDVGAGKSAGCKTILLDALHNRDITADYRVRSILEIPEIISR